MLRSWSAALYVLCLSVAQLVPIPLLACTQIERRSLLSFLSDVSAPADRPLRWPGGTDDCCLWEGVTCDAGGSVVHLLLPARGLAGNLSSSLQGLGSLVELNLSRNSFCGLLPRFILWSDHIVVLDLSLNLLTGQLPPPPPPSLENSTRLYAIQFLNLSSNRFKGEFPHLGELAHLREVDASNNSFSGPITSPACGHFSGSIRILDLSFNRFAGSLPPGLGNCSELAVLDAGFNDLSGQIPDDLFAAAQLRHLALPYNRFVGRLRGELISRLPNLIVLDLRGNELEGELPRDLGSLTRLRQLLLGENRFNGSIPQELLRNCTNLRTLDLMANRLIGDISAFDFSMLSQLRALDLGDNNFSAYRFPESIYACTSLTAIRLTNCSIGGQLSPGLLRLRSLSYLSLSYNHLKGFDQALNILRKSKNLTALLLGGNFNGEAMPDGPDAQWEGSFPNLRVLSLVDCQLTGMVPTWISKLGKLEALSLSKNQLGGGIPSWIGSLKNLFFLQLSGNRLTGEIPLEITKISAMQLDPAQIPEDESPLDLPIFRQRTKITDGLRYSLVSSLPASLLLQNNSLSGAIPPAIGQLKRLRALDLSANNFSGEIPASLSDLSFLETLNLSGNHLCGPIPKTLIRLTFLSTFSVAGNNLSGPVPSEGQFRNFPASSYKGNEYLCGPVLNISCSFTASDAKKTANDHWVLIAATIIAGIGAVLIIGFLLFLFTRKAKKTDKSIEEADLFSVVTGYDEGDEDGSRDLKAVVLSSAGNLPKELTISEIMEATDNFSQENLVGCGGFGMVYKAVLGDGTELAIKRLSSELGLMVEKEFAAEVETLSRARHENLVPLLGYCVRGGLRLLIYAYMHNGSLDAWLHEDDGGCRLDWPARLRIAEDVSRGLAHVHLACNPPIIHRDIKSSNILLDSGFRAHLADFGLARLILPQYTHVSTELVGTLGYIPPEYGNAWVATLRGDVYSFGVVLLELITGRRPVDMIGPRESSDLVASVLENSRLGEEHVSAVFDPRLRGNGFEDQMTAVLRLACLCVSHAPNRRPGIAEIVRHLAAVRSIFPSPQSTLGEQPSREAGQNSANGIDRDG